jgi:hypothetical protein
LIPLILTFSLREKGLSTLNLMAVRCGIRTIGTITSSRRASERDYFEPISPTKMAIPVNTLQSWAVEAIPHAAPPSTTTRLLT